MRRLFLKAAAVILAAGLLLAGCGNPAGGGGGGGEPDVVSAFNLTSLVTAPVTGANQVTTPVNHTQYTGSIAWQRENGTAHTGAFEASTVYKAVVTLTANSGWTFSGVGAGSFSYSGATVTNTTGSGTITVTITFPATAGEGEPNRVTAFDLTGLVTAPVTGAAPDTTAIDEDQYTGSIAWQTENGDAHTGPFAVFTVYKAALTLTAKTGWTFSGLEENSFTYTSAAAANAANSGVVTITFPATAAVTVTALSLDGLVTTPVTDATPDTTAIDETQYEVTIAWQTQGGVAHTGTFAASTVYKAVVTLTANTGWTFDGLGTGNFSYTGAAVTSTTGSETVTVTITFPATAAANAGIPIGNPSVALYLNGGTTPLVHNGTTNISVGTGTYTVSIGEGEYSSIVWKFNGAPVTGADDKTSITLSRRTVGTYLLNVEATPVNGVKNSGAHTFEVK